MIGAAMRCGVGVEVCGVLALMTGLGGGVQNVTGSAVYGLGLGSTHVRDVGLGSGSGSGLGWTAPG